MGHSVENSETNKKKVIDDQISCDGCEREDTVGNMSFVVDYGHECRFCPECAREYEQWHITTQAEEARRQKEFDLWQLAMRRHVPLKLMPMDMPPVQRRARGLPLVLG